MTMPMIKAMIWFLVREDANNPMEEKAAPSRMAPMYPPITGPQSISPKNEIKIGYANVGISMADVKAVAAKNFPSRTSRKVTGSVSSVSYVPILNAADAACDIS